MEEFFDPLTFKLVKVPTTLYNEWREITWNMSDIEAVKTIIFDELKKWILADYSSFKLCAFDEFNNSEAKRYGLTQGMYVIIRKMTDEELQLSKQIKEGLSTKDHPQWTLEVDVFNLNPAMLITIS
jgi:hypothetical protein